MKKLKIFLLLCLLVCFGFALSSEVHAQGAGPKLFEVDDVFPQGIIRIFWQVEDSPYLYVSTIEDEDFIGWFGSTFYINNVQIFREGGPAEFPPEWLNGFTGVSGGNNYIDIDMSSWTLNQRTIDYIDGDVSDFFWIDLNAPSAKIFEEGDVLPAGYIKISWDFTGKPVSDGLSFIILGYGIEIEINQYDLPYSGYYTEIYIDGETFIGDTPGYTVILLPEPAIIDSFGYDEGQYYEYIHGAIFWEVVSEEEFIYSDGYNDGYTDGRYWGYEHGRIRYGYYDPITGQWLSVEEYLELYGTDKLGQSDFYNNFDKYFIPAMIIVFGGAIIITVLKVFKGRE